MSNLKEPLRPLAHKVKDTMPEREEEHISKPLYSDPTVTPSHQEARGNKVAPQTESLHNPMEETAMKQLVYGPQGAIGGGSTQTQISLMRDSRLKSQHGMMMAEIGRVQGNQHVQRMVAEVNRQPTQGLDILGFEGFGFKGLTGLSPTPPAENPPRVQTKLTVNEPGDAYEQEADAVASQVMRMEEDEVASTSLSHSGQVQREATAPNTPPITPEIESSISSMSGRGQALPESERNFLEPRMGYDFSQVRIHTDSQAAETSNALQARAFTVGSDVAFAPGEYQPGTDAGRRLLAHELTHVVQQGGAGAVQRKEVQPTPTAYGPVMFDPSAMPFASPRVDSQTNNAIQTKPLAPQTAYGPVMFDPSAMPFANQIESNSAPNPFTPNPISIRETIHGNDIKNEALSLPTTSQDNQAIDNNLQHDEISVDSKNKVPLEEKQESMGEITPPKTDLNPTPENITLKPELQLSLPQNNIPESSPPSSIDDPLINPLQGIGNDVAGSSDILEQESPPAEIQEAPSLIVQDEDAIAATIPNAEPLPDASTISLQNFWQQDVESSANITAKETIQSPEEITQSLDDLWQEAQQEVAKKNDNKPQPILAENIPLPEVKPLDKSFVDTDANTNSEASNSLDTSPTNTNEVSPKNDNNLINQPNIDNQSKDMLATQDEISAPKADSPSIDIPKQPVENNEANKADTTTVAEVTPSNELDTNNHPNDSNNNPENINDESKKATQDGTSENGQNLVIQRVSMNPLDWAKDAFNALKGDASSYESQLEGQKSPKQTEVSNHAQTKSTELQTQGDTKGGELQTQGDTKGSELQSQSQTKGSELQSQSQTKGAELQSQSETKGAELQAESEAKQAEVESAAETKGTELQCKVDVKAEEIQTHTQEKRNELETDWTSLATESQTTTADIQTQAESKVSLFEKEALTTQQTVEQNWTGFQDESNSLMQSLDQQAGEWCAKYQGKAQAFIQQLDTMLQPAYETAKETWKAIEKEATEAWDAFIKANQPMIDLLNQKWQAFSAFAQAQWNTLLAGAKQLAQDVGQLIAAGWKKLQAGWQWLNEKATAIWNGIKEKLEEARNWVRAEADLARTFIREKAIAARAFIKQKADAARLWISDKADAARLWISDKADAARDWISNKGDIAREWISGKADAAREWINGKADAAVKWIGDKGHSIVSNLSDKAQGFVSSVSSKGGPIMEWFGGMVNSLISGVEGVGHNVVDSVQNAADLGLHWVEDKAKWAVDFIEGKSKGVVNLVEQKSTEGVDFIEQKSTEGVNLVEQKSTEGVNFVEQKSTEGVNLVEQKSTQAVNTVENIALGSINLVEQLPQLALKAFAVTFVGMMFGPIAAGLMLAWPYISGPLGQFAQFVNQKITELGVWVNDTIIQPTWKAIQEQWQKIQDAFVKQFPGLTKCWEVFKEYAGVTTGYFSQKMDELMDWVHTLPGWLQVILLGGGVTLLTLFAAPLGALTPGMPFIGMMIPGSLLLAYDAWTRLPAWLQELLKSNTGIVIDTFLAFIPIVGDGLDLIRELGNWALGRGMNETVVMLAIVGLGLDLGWLNGPFDPLDGANAGVGLLKAIAKRLDGPALEAFQKLYKEALNDPEAMAKLMDRANIIRQDEELLMLLGKNPEQLLDFLKTGEKGLKEAGQEGLEGLQDIGKGIDDIPDGRTTHFDEPQIEPGIVAKQPAADGHEIKVLKDGKIVRCSTCEEMRFQYANELATNPKLASELDAIEQIPNPAKKAQAAADLEKKLADIRGKGYQRPERLTRNEGESDSDYKERLNEWYKKNKAYTEYQEKIVNGLSNAKLEIKEDVNKTWWEKATQREKELAYDVAHEGRITDKGINEARVGLEAEQAGLIKGPIRRHTDRSAEFVDGNSHLWDVKRPDNPQSIANDLMGGERILIEGRLEPEAQKDLTKRIISELKNQNAKEEIIDNLKDHIVFLPQK